MFGVGAPLEGAGVVVLVVSLGVVRVGVFAARGRSEDGVDGRLGLSVGSGSILRVLSKDRSLLRATSSVPPGAGESRRSNEVRGVLGVKLLRFNPLASGRGLGTRSGLDLDRSTVILVGLKLLRGDRGTRRRACLGVGSGADSMVDGEYERADTGGSMTLHSRRC